MGNPSATVLNARELMQKKEQIEKEISEYEQVLKGVSFSSFS